LKGSTIHHLKVDELISGAKPAVVDDLVKSKELEDHYRVRQAGHVDCIKLFALKKKKRR